MKDNTVKIYKVEKVKQNWNNQDFGMYYYVCCRRQNNTFKFDEYNFAKNAQGKIMIMQEAFIIFNFLQTKPQIIIKNTTY